MFALSTSLQPVPELLVSTIRQEEEIKGIQIGNEEVKLTLLCRWHDLVHNKYYKNHIGKKLLELTNEFSKAAGYNINIQN